MPRRRHPAYECSFCGEELPGEWAFPLHSCDAVRQFEVMISRVLSRMLGQSRPAEQPAPDPMREKLRRAAETIAAAAGIQIPWESVVEFPEDFMRVLRQARAATHPDRSQGNEELYKLVGQAAELLKTAFRQKGIQV